jgi:hypothetical protein
MSNQAEQNKKDQKLSRRHAARMREEDKEYRKLYLHHASLLLLLCFLGIIFAYVFNLIAFDFSGEIRKARALGIVSVTVQTGYPKTRDLVTYASVFLFPVLFALGGWYLWAKKYMSRLGNLFYTTEDVPAPKNVSWVLALAFVAVFYLFVSFNRNFFYYPAWNSYSGAWSLLGEEGVDLAWMQSIFSGGVYGKDFFCLYGPMLIYPLAWFMKIFGTTVVAERAWKYILDLMAYGIIIFFLYKTLRWKTWFILSSVVFLFFFTTFDSWSLNRTYLRVVLGILPLLVIYFFFGNNKKYLLMLAGLVIGQSLLFSQEVGFCSFIAVLTGLALHFYFKSEGRSFVHACILVAFGTILSVAPMLIYLSAKGAFAPFLADFIGYPKLIMLGYACLPFAAFKAFIANPLGEPLFFFWPIFVYIAVTIYVVPSLLSGKADKDQVLKVSLLIFGLLLFRIALGRSSHENIQRILPPAMLLLFLIIDSSLTTIKWARFRFLRAAHITLICALVLSTTVVVFHTFELSYRFPMTMNKLKRSLSEKLSTATVFGDQVPSVERGGVFYDSKTAHELVAIRDFLEANTQPGDYVYFFPNEAAYYFLFNRNNPTRYSFSYTAVTAAQRKELVGDLEKNKPQYVVYSRNTWRVDDIMEDVQVPEVVSYLQDHYRIYQDLGDVVIEKRIGT